MLHQLLHRGRYIRYHNGGRGVQARGEEICLIISRLTRDPHDAAGFGLQTAALGIGRQYTAPRLQEGGFGIPHAFADGQQTRALVGVKYFRADQVVLDQPSGNGIAVGRAFTILIDIGLYGQSLAGVVLAL
ncbi:hypothetical protein [Desulfobacter hydrogenophilus]|uniref:hypothetical protein n=1 Tax=Desulfobacter hydrogenophilus TaxID=2291 RepID=UPI001F5EB72B|nr:hypothetical protein [Desulfobacter hydrogenophilus]